MNPDTMAMQHLLAAMTDNPARFAERPFAALIKQCHDARDGSDGGGLHYFEVPF